MTESFDEADPNVVSLPGEQPPAPPVTPPGKVHGLATAGMALCAVVGIVATLLFITIRWPGESGRFVVATVVLAGLGFFLCASIAIFAAARDTYARSPRGRDPEDH
jgi:hypothetical protein